MLLMIRVNGHITLSSKVKSLLNKRKLKQNTHLKQDLCSGFTRKFLTKFLNAAAVVFFSLIDVSTIFNGMESFVNIAVTSTRLFIIFHFFGFSRFRARF